MRTPAERVELLELGARLVLRLLYRGGIEGGSADACNLFDLFQEGLGNCDEAPQVPLAEAVRHVRGALGSGHAPCCRDAPVHLPWFWGMPGSGGSGSGVGALERAALEKVEGLLARL